MTQTICTPASNPEPKPGTRSPTPWAALARQAIRQLEADLAYRLSASGDPALDPDDMALPDLLAPAMSFPGSRALDALNRNPAAQNIPPEDYDAIAQAGGDPTATDADGTAQPRISLPAGKLIPLLRLVASIGSVADRDAMLDPGAITMLEGIPGNLIDQLKQLLPHALPEGWVLATSMSRRPRDKPCLLILGPEVLNGKISDDADRAFAAELATSIDARAPILILLPESATAPKVLHQPPIRRQAFAPLSLEILLTALRATHSATGRIDEAAVRAALSSEEVLADLDTLSLSLAMRAPSAKAVAEQIATLTAKARSPRPRVRGWKISTVTPLPCAPRGRSCGTCADGRRAMSAGGI